MSSTAATTSTATSTTGASIPSPTSTALSPVAETKTETKKSFAVEPAPPVITLAGKVAIVTGGSRGIGAATAVRLAHDGASVIVNYNTSIDDAKTVVDIITTAGGKAEAVQADVGTIAGVERLFSEAKRIYKKIDIVIANAGIYTPTAGPLSELTSSGFDKVYDVNVKGIAWLLKLSSTQVENGGRIVTIGSVVHRGKYPGNAVYASTKAAVETLSSGLAIELAPKLITVNTIHPSATDTEMLTAAAGEAGKSHVISTSPSKRLGTTGDVGDAISLIVSERARWITGQAINVSGGQSD